ncbi:hypothetical protein [Methylohalobius crimeensis]|uniref:hypothetical protein n=1 Tax=Methylohalobius crimeensis TaxID=244365 RepID=UPI0003B72718|nr:hypothetical protein [Methylohalobius crimeensis]
MTKSYLITWLLTVCLCLVGIGVLNYLVDPYGLIETIRIDGFNDDKPAAANRSYLFKPYQVIRRQPEILIIGNSRPEMGLNPRHECLRKLGKVYSLTFPGTDMYMQARYLQHAISGTSPLFVFIGIDFLDFLVPADSLVNPMQWPPRRSPQEKRLLVTAEGDRNPDYGLAKFVDYRNSLISLTALSDSIKTLGSQNTPYAVTRTAEGFNPAEGYYRNIIHTEGQGVLFAQKKQQLANRLKRNWGLMEGKHDWSRPLEALKHILHWLNARDARAIVFINPYHAEYLELIRQSGHWPLFERWKQLIVRLVTQEYQATLWDFSNFNRYTTEKPPPTGDLVKELKWFWEPAHYRDELGQLILQTMLRDFGCKVDDSLTKPGIQLTRTNIDQHLKSQNQARLHYEMIHRDLIAAIRRLFDSS